MSAQEIRDAIRAVRRQESAIIAKGVPHHGSARAEKARTLFYQRRALEAKLAEVSK